MFTSKNLKKNLYISTKVEKQVRKGLLKHRMDCVVISVMCLSMPNTGMENDGKYEADFFLSNVIYNMKVLHFKHSYTLKGCGIVLSQITCDTIFKRSERHRNGK
jgi:hypothetical protein